MRELTKAMSDKPTDLVDREWEAGQARMPTGEVFHVVVDKSYGNAIVASTGQVNADEPEADAVNAYHAQLIASIPASSALLVRTLNALEGMVRQHPESASNRSPAGKEARAVLAITRTAMKLRVRPQQPPQPEGETK
jgi:hypothetical protein